MSEQCESQRANLLQSLKPLPKTVLPKICNGTSFLETQVSNLRLRNEVLDRAKLDSSDPQILNSLYVPIKFEKCPEAPNLAKLKAKTSGPGSLCDPKPQSGLDSKNPKTSGPGSQSGIGRPISTGLLKSYNKFMNQMNELSNEALDPKLQSGLRPLVPSAEVPKLFESGKSEALDPKLFESGSLDPKPHTVQAPKVHYSNDLELLFEEDPKDLAQVSNPKPLCGLETLFPKTEDIDEDVIVKINISKKDCKVRVKGSKDPLDVTSYFLKSYSSVRENTDNIIFGIKSQSDIDSEDSLKFYCGSKQAIFDDYTSQHKQLYFHLKLWTSKDSVTVFWIPTVQIISLLEYSHPVYEIEKTKFSMNLYSLIPLELRS